MHQVAWRVEKPTDGPRILMEPRYPWDEDVHSHGTVLVDPIDGLWKAWYVSTGGVQQGLHNAGNGRAITYAFSKDGLNWTRPLLDIQPYKNYTHTNILLTLGGADPGPNQASVSYCSVFINTDAALDHRYDMFVLYELPPVDFQGKVPFGCGNNVPKGNPGRGVCMYRMKSSDGVHWSSYGVVPPANRAVRELCVCVCVYMCTFWFVFCNTVHITVRVCLQQCNCLCACLCYVPAHHLTTCSMGWVGFQTDGSNVYRQADGSFVQYIKTNLPAFPGGAMPMDVDAGTTRVQAISTSPDGYNWTDARIIATADWRDGSGTQMQEISPVRALNGIQVGTMTMMHAATAEVDIQFTASRDGESWWRPVIPRTQQRSRAMNIMSLTVDFSMLC